MKKTWAGGVNLLVLHTKSKGGECKQVKLYRFNKIQIQSIYTAVWVAEDVFQDGFLWNAPLLPPYFCGKAAKICGWFKCASQDMLSLLIFTRTKQAANIFIPAQRVGQ